jgi:peptide/nickel transport system permease protein
MVLARALQGTLLLFALSFGLFALLSAMPGDPVDLLVASNPELRPEDVARLKKLRGLDQPVPVRWWRWLAGHPTPQAPPSPQTLPPFFFEAERQDDQDTPRPTLIRLPLPTPAAGAPRVVRALPPATLDDDGLVTVLLMPGATRVVVVLIDQHGQEAALSIPVYVAPPLPGAKDATDPDDPAMIDGEEPLIAGGTEASRPELRPNADIAAAASAVAPMPAPIATVDVDDGDGDGDAFVGQRVVVRDGAVVVERGAPLAVDGAWTCGVLCVFRGDLSGLGWSWATKRPVAELLFGRDAVCGDGFKDGGEGCDDGNVIDGDGCSATCVDEGKGVAARVDHTIATGLTGLGRVGNTLFLTVPALLIAMFLSLVLGSAAALRGGAVDAVVRGGAAVVASTPAFFVGLILVTLFAEWWRVLPSGGVFSPGIQESGAGAVVVDRLRHVLLPCTVLILFWSGRLVRQVRSAVVAVKSSDLVRTARMKGASPWRVYRRHILPNAAIPLVTLVGLSLPQLFGGALLTETVFAWPGLGRLQYDAVMQNDSYVAVVVFLLSAAMVMGGSLFADVVVVLLDPRRRHRPRGRA